MSKKITGRVLAAGAAYSVESTGGVILEATGFFAAAFADEEDEGAADAMYSLPSDLDKPGLFVLETCANTPEELAEESMDNWRKPTGEEWERYKTGGVMWPDENPMNGASED